MKKSLTISLIAMATLASGYGLWKYLGNSDSGFTVRHVAILEDDAERWSILDLESGKIVVDKEWKQEPEYVSEGIVTIENKDGEFELFTIAEKPKRIGKTFASAGMCLDGLIPVAESDKPLSYINAKGETIFVLKDVDGKSVTEAGHFREGRARFKNSDGKFGFIDNKGSVVIKAQFDDASDFREGHALVTIKKKNGTPGDSTYKEVKTVGLINRNGEFTIQPKEADSNSMVPTQTPSNDLVMFTEQKDGKNRVGFMDPKGNVVIKADKSFQRGTPFLGEYAAYSNGEEWGLMDRKGESVIRPKYDMCFFFDDILYIREKNKWGCATVDGKELIEPEFREILPFFNKHTVARDGKDFILINRAGKEVSANSFKLAHYNRLMAAWMTGNYPMVKSDLLDADGLLARILNELQTPDLKALNGKSVNEMARLFGKEEEDISTYSSSMSKYIFSIEDVSVSLKCQFSASLKKYDNNLNALSYRDYEATINPDAKVTSLELEIELYKRLQPKNDRILAALKNHMQKLGYAAAANANAANLILFNDSLAAITKDDNTFTLHLSFDKPLDLSAFAEQTEEINFETPPIFDDLRSDAREPVDAPPVEEKLYRRR